MSARSRCAEALGVRCDALLPLGAGGGGPLGVRSFKATLADGTQVKVRSARTMALAMRAARTSELLDDPRVPPPLHQIGLVTVERWVDGETAGPADVEGAADLLAAIHVGERGRGGGPVGRRRTGPIVSRAIRQASELRPVLGALADRARDVVVGGCPPVSSWGITHGDFAGDNLVRRPDGVVVSIDHELLGAGYLEYDLARSWHRWPEGRDGLEECYRARLGVDRLAEPEWRAWRVAATLKSIHLRFRRGIPHPAGVEDLRILSRGRGCGP